MSRKRKALDELIRYSNYTLGPPIGALNRRQDYTTGYVHSDDIDIEVIDNSQQYTSGTQEACDTEDLSIRKLKICEIIGKGGFSKNQLALLSEYAKLATGSRIKILNSECEQMMNELYVTEYDPRILVYCPVCYVSVRQPSSVCLNFNCSSFKKANIKHTPTQKSVVVTVSSKNQLQQIVRRNFQHLLQVHRHLLFGYNGFDEKPSMTSLSKKYIEKMEKSEDFKKHRLVLPYSISFDGFVSNRHSRSETTPLYVRLEGLSCKAKRKSDNVILAAMHRGYHGVKTDDVQYFVTRLKNEMENMKINIEHRGRTYEVQFRNMLLIADLKGLNSIFGYPCWRSTDGCARCDIIATKYGRCICFGSMTDIQLLSNAEVKSKISSKMKENVLGDFCSLANTVYDDLHCYAEGGGKNALRDVFTSSSKWIGLRIRNDLIEEIKEACTTYTASKRNENLLVTFLANSKQSGCDIRESLFVLLPLVGISNNYHYGEFNLWLIGTVALAELIMRKNADTNVLKMLGKSLKYIHLKFNARSLTIKFHLLYDHSPLDYENFGCLREVDSSDFEKFHRDLQVNLNPNSVKLSDMVKRFIMRREMVWRNQLETLDPHKGHDKPHKGHSYDKLSGRWVLRTNKKSTAPEPEFDADQGSLFNTSHNESRQDMSPQAVSSTFTSRQVFPSNTFIQYDNIDNI